NVTPLGSSFANSASGTFGLHNGTSLTVNGNFANGNVLDVDSNTFEGGSSLTIKGTLTNSKIVQIGNGALGATTTLSLGGLVNSSGASFHVNGAGSTLAKLIFTGGATSFTKNDGDFELTTVNVTPLGSSFTNSASGTF